ncbi:MAG: glycosyltransferase family 9 protein [Pseudomonadota bacterium]
MTFKNNAHMAIGYWNFQHKLKADVPYVVFDKFFSPSGELQDTFVIRELKEEIPLYQGEDLSGKSLLFTSMGGYGDGLSLIQAINTLKHKYPSAQIDLMVHLDMFFFLRQFSFQGDWVEYPVSLDYLKRYDYLQTSERLYNVENYYRKNVARMFCDLLHVPLDLNHSTFRPTRVANALNLGASEKKRVALQVDALTGDKRCYPVHLIKELAELLSGNDLEVYLVGLHKGLFFFQNGGKIYNFVNRLSTVTDLAGLLSQMDGIIAPDSVGGHLGGLMNIPTIALFNVTGIDKMDHYPSVYGMQSELPCSPCYQLYKCPLGYENCKAMEHASVSPAQVMNKIREVIRLR